jgi:hypothetical protein
MRNNHLLGLGSALLATTSLATAASAANIVPYATLSNAGAIPQPVASTLNFSSQKIAAQLFASGGLTATSTVGPQNISVTFTNNYNTSLAPRILLTITGANFNSTSLATGSAAAAVTAYQQTNGSVVATMTGGQAGCTVGILSSQIQITGCVSSSFSVTTGANTNTSFALSGIVLSGLVYTAATNLATVGNTITLGGGVNESANPSNQFEAITSTAVVASVNSAAVSTATATVTVNQGAGATPFVTVSQTLGANVGGGLTIALAEVNITGVGAVDNTFTAVGQSAAGGLSLTLNSAALADPAIANVRFIHEGGNSIATATTLTSTATFSNTSLTSAAIYLNTAVGTNYVQVEYNGTTSLTGGAAGTLSGTFSAVGGNYAGALPAISGSTSVVNRGGFNTQINSVQASTNTSVTSYIRVSNASAAAGAATLTVYNAATGTAIGTYTTASIPGFGTLQVSAKDIETGANITPSAGQSYNIVITGPLNGYAQHITGNPGGLFVDFSGRRQSVTGNN